MANKKMLSTVTKTFLKNVINHTDSHNKVVEESEMWSQRQKQLTDDKPGNSRDCPSSSHSFLKDRGVDMQFEYSTNLNRQAHMDEEPRSTYWMNELYKAEEADNNRWGHNGFKEMYPEKFDQSRTSSCNGCSASRRQQSSRKRMKYIDSNTDSSKSRSRKSAHHAASSDSSDSESYRKYSKHRKHKRKQSSRSCSDSDMNYSKHRRRNRNVSESSSDLSEVASMKQHHPRKNPSSRSSTELSYSKLYSKLKRRKVDIRDTDSTDNESYDSDQYTKKTREKKHKKHRSKMELETATNKADASRTSKHKQKKKKKKHKKQSKAKYES